VSPEQTFLATYLWNLLTEFNQTFTTKSLTDFGAKMNVSNFGVKNSRVKVMIGSNIPPNALFGLVSTIFRVFVPCLHFITATVV